MFNSKRLFSLKENEYIVQLLDYDGCSQVLFTKDFLLDWNVNEKSNLGLLRQLKTDARKAEKIFIAIGSIRQDGRLDQYNTARNQNGSCFKVFPILVNYLKNVPNANVEFSNLTVTDIEHDKEAGSAIVDNSLQWKNIDANKITILMTHLYHDYWHDDKKALCIKFYDDRFSILAYSAWTFKHFPFLIPKGKTLEFYFYSEKFTQKEPILLEKIKGQGTGINKYVWKLIIKKTSELIRNDVNAGKLQDKQNFFLELCNIFSEHISFQFNQGHVHELYSFVCNIFKDPTKTKDEVLQTYLREIKEYITSNFSPTTVKNDLAAILKKDDSFNRNSMALKLSDTIGGNYLISTIRYSIFLDLKMMAQYMPDVTILEKTHNFLKKIKTAKDMRYFLSNWKSLNNRFLSIRDKLKWPEEKWQKFYLDYASLFYEKCLKKYFHFQTMRAKESGARVSIPR